MLELKENMEVKILAAGTNFVRAGSMLSLGLTGYHSRLPNGVRVAVYNAHPGIACVKGHDEVDRGIYHFAFTSPSWFAQAAAEGRIDIGWTPRKLKLAAVGAFPHHDMIVLAVRRELGLRSLHEVRERRIPLRISTGPTHLAHTLGWTMDALLAEYGMTIEDIERWGGSVRSSDRQLNVLPEGRAGLGNRVTAMQRGDLDAVFDEGIMSKTWKDITDTVDLDFLPIEDDVLDRLKAKYGIPRTVIPAGRFRGIDRDIPTIEFGGWLLYCHSELPDELVYNALVAFEEQKEQLESLYEGQRPYQGLSEMPLNMATLAKNTYLPLHPGAEAYYRDRGYIG